MNDKDELDKKIMEKVSLSYLPIGKKFRLYCLKRIPQQKFYLISGMIIESNDLFYPVILVVSYELKIVLECILNEKKYSNISLNNIYISKKEFIVIGKNKKFLLQIKINKFNLNLMKTQLKKRPLCGLF